MSIPLNPDTGARSVEIRDCSINRRRCARLHAHNRMSSLQPFADSRYHGLSDLHHDIRRITQQLNALVSQIGNNQDVNGVKMILFVAMSLISGGGLSDILVILV